MLRPVRLNNPNHMGQIVLGGGRHDVEKLFGAPSKRSTKDLLLDDPPSESTISTMT